MCGTERVTSYRLDCYSVPFCYGASMRLFCGIVNLKFRAVLLFYYPTMAERSAVGQWSVRVYAHACG